MSRSRISWIGRLLCILFRLSDVQKLFIYWRYEDAENEFNLMRQLYKTCMNYKSEVQQKHLRRLWMPLKGGHLSGNDFVKVVFINTPWNSLPSPNSFVLILPRLLSMMKRKPVWQCNKYAISFLFCIQATPLFFYYGESLNLQLTFSRASLFPLLPYHNGNGVSWPSASDTPVKMSLTKVKTLYDIS